MRKLDRRRLQHLLSASLDIAKATQDPEMVKLLDQALEIAAEADDLTEEDNKHINLMVKRADAGDAEAGRDALRQFGLESDDEHVHPLLLRYARDRIWAYLEDGAPLEGARQPSKGGRPETELMRIAAIDILLRDYLGFEKKTETALDETAGIVKVSPSTVRNARNEYDGRFNKHADHPLMEKYNIDLLIDLAIPIPDSMYRKLNDLQKL